MAHERVAIIGGTGFVGRSLVCTLTRRGVPTRVLTRRRERHRELLVFPTCQLVECDVHDLPALSERLRGCDAVVNLAGILNASAAGGFDAVHADLPAKIGEAMGFNRIRRLLHMSALGASPDGPSEYLKSKAEGERRAHALAERGVAVTSFRPSVIFGEDDSFLNRFALLLKLSPIAFPLACPHARFAPAWVEDVVDALVHCLDDDATHGEGYDLCGPGEYALAELVEYTAEVCGLSRRVVGLDDRLSRLQARVMEHVPGKPFSTDNYLSLQKDSVCTGDDGFAALGIAPTSLEAIVPHYLGAAQPEARRQRYRTAAGRGR